MKKEILLIFVCCLCMGTAYAQEFDKYFCDKTLRLDLNFSGNADKQYIALDELCSFDGWYGKRKRLTEVPMQGNGEVLVYKHNSKEALYKNSFSTLFQEWLSYDEAKTLSRSFENVFLVPMPKDTVDITVNLYNNRQLVCATSTFTVNPKDILIRHLACDSLGNKITTPYEVLQQSKLPDLGGFGRCINIAFVAEGYQESEMDTFINDAQVAVEAIFEHEPFKNHRECFNIIAVKSPSLDSGTSEPGNGIWKRTALSSHFDTFYSDRYLTTLHLKDLHNVLAGLPYEHIIVLVNTEKYGGGGILNSYNLTMTHHEYYRPVVVHEFGHSFAGLADEYAYDNEAIPMYPHDIEPWEKNITTKVDFHGKWENLISEKEKKSKSGKEKKLKSEKVGFYEGAGYSLKGVWRACKSCRMRDNNNPEFCPACQKAITEVIDFYTK